MLAEDMRRPERQPIVFEKEVGQNIKDKKTDKRGRDEDPSWEGSLKREVSKHQETLTSGSVGSFGISVQFSYSVVSDSLRPHESQHARPPCPSPIPRVHSNSRPPSQ